MRRIVSAVMCVLALVLAANAAEAGQITLAWDANTEPDIAGYVIQWGPASAPFTNSTDAGNTTTWTLTSATEGVTYSFRVVAYNSAGEYSDASAAVSGTVAPPPGPSGLSLTLNRTLLNFGVVRSGATVLQQTRAQTVDVAQTGTGTMTWSLAANQPWVQIAPATGSGNGAITVSVNAALAPASGNADAVITASSPQAGNGPQTIAVHLAQMSSGASGAPTGSFDTPVDNASNLAGAVAVTGWALDDVQVDRVEVWRDPVGTEPVAANGKVFIGNAVFVAGARTDVEALAPAAPLNYRAGWGYLLLTNALPDGVNATGGNGTYTLYAYAIDVEGHAALLGSKRIAAANATALAPFGTLDTPGQGETISGSAYVSFGWALSPRSTIAADGSTIDAYIDGVNVGHPTYNNYRADIANAFAGYGNSSGAVGFLVIDTTKLSNGVHTIGWIARDAAGNTQGLGSRFFGVLNSGTASAVAAAQSASAQSASALTGVPIANDAIEVRRAATPQEGALLVVPEYTGDIDLRATEMEMIELRLASRFAADGQGRYEGFQLVRDELRPLPSGSTFDAAEGVFRWQPGPAFVGAYDFLFVRTSTSGSQTKIPVHLRIAPGATGAAR